jgi:hypothetical protein
MSARSVFQLDHPKLKNKSLHEKYATDVFRSDGFAPQHKLLVIILGMTGTERIA